MPSPLSLSSLPTALLFVDLSSRCSEKTQPMAASPSSPAHLSPVTTSDNPFSSSSSSFHSFISKKADPGLYSGVYLNARCNYPHHGFLCSLNHWHRLLSSIQTYRLIPRLRSLRVCACLRSSIFAARWFVFSPKRLRSGEHGHILPRWWRQARWSPVFTFTLSTFVFWSPDSLFRHQRLGEGQQCGLDRVSWAVTLTVVRGVRERRKGKEGRKKEQR